MAEHTPTLVDVMQRFKHGEIGDDLYIGVVSWPTGAWSVKVPAVGREIFEMWLADLEAAMAAAQPASEAP